MTKRVLIGAFPGGGYGVRVSKSGYDVTSNPVDQSQLTFNSDWKSMLPIYKRGSVSVPNNTTQTISYTSLGYLPFILGYYYGQSLNNSGATGYFVAMPTEETGGAGIYLQMQYTDNTIYVGNQNPYGYNVTYYYIILYLKAA